MGGCVSKGSKEKDPDKAPYGDKDADDKDKAADDTKAQETVETPAKTEDTADKDAEKEKDDAESNAKEDDKKEDDKKDEPPVADNQVVIKVGNDDTPETKAVTIDKESTTKAVSQSSSSTSYTKEEVRSFGKSSVVTTEVEGSSSGGDLSKQAQELIEKFRSEGPDAIEGVVKTMSSERKVVSSVTSTVSSGDGPPKVESVTTTSHSVSKTDPEGKTTKESTTTTEMKGCGPTSAIVEESLLPNHPAIKIEVTDDSKKEEEAAKGPVLKESTNRGIANGLNGHVTHEEHVTDEKLVSPPKPAQPIEAEVVISKLNGTPKTVEPQVVVKPEMKRTEIETVTPPAESAEKDTDVSDEDILEPVHRANLKKTVKSLLVDLAPYNESIQKRNSIELNTRAKLLHSFDKWFLNAESEKSGSNIMALVGQPGVGKTCFAAEVCRRHKTKLAGSHFFQPVTSSLDLNDPRCVVMSLAHALCDVFPNYANMLPKAEKMEDLVLNGEVVELFEELLQKPLSSAELVHDSEEHMLIVIDALDECILDEREPFLKVLNQSGAHLPDWLYVLLTVSGENQILGQLDKAQVLEMKKSNDNLTDIKRYLRGPMSKYMDRISLDGGLTQLAKKSEGSFLGAYLAHKKLDALPSDTKIALRSIDAMFPNGFNALCQAFFKGYLESLITKSTEKDAHNMYSVLLGILVSIRQPLHTDFIQYCSFGTADVLSDLMDVLYEEDGCVSLCHPHITDWLCKETLSGELSASLAVGRDKLAELCLAWLAPLTEEGKSNGVNPKLKEYALKHAIWHLTDVPKQQENVTKLLCSLKYIQGKLGVAGVNLSHLIGDYKHAHYQRNGDTTKLITMSEYMRRQPKLAEQMNSYYKFVSQRGTDLNQNSEFTLHTAANYPTIQRIQQNARLELSRMPWLEDLTAVSESHGVTKALGGQILAFDLSQDGKNLALVTKDTDYNLNLHLLNPQNGERKIDPVDVKGIKNRVGLAMKFLPDGSIFVGSLTTLINPRGKPVASSIDMQSIQMKEKFSIECCAVSARYLACGLTTFPWNGRSLHLSVFDMKVKKCTKTLEVLRFRFGGSAQFGVRCCAMSADETQVAACVKQSNKPQLKVNIWSISSWNVTHSVDLESDTVTKCTFVNKNMLWFGSSVRSMTDAAGYSFSPTPAQSWNFSDKSAVPIEIERNSDHSVFVHDAKRTVLAKWGRTVSSSTVSVWQKSDLSKPCDHSYNVRGLKQVADVRSIGDFLVFVGNDELKIFNVNDLESMDPSESTGEKVSAMRISVVNVGLFPRSDDVIISHCCPSDRNQQVVSVGVLDPRQEDMTMAVTPFQNEQRRAFNTRDSIGQFKCFRGPGCTLEVCSSSADGNFLIFNAGDRVKVWNRSLDNVYSIPTYFEQSDKSENFTQYAGVNCAISAKETTVGVVYGQLPNNIYLHDLKSKKMTQKISLVNDGHPCVVSDFCFLPSNGNVLSYHREFQHGLVVWNQRNGSEVSRDHSTPIAYAKASPASDRFVLSLHKTKHEGELVLRNSDRRFHSSLSTAGIWLASSDHSDLDFSVDGTILVGIAMETGICRVWNAGNGEVLKDLKSSFTRQAEIVGMLTNTHVVFHEERRLTVRDVGSGECVAVLPLEDPLPRKVSRAGLRITSRGNFMVGAKRNGQLAIFECHNFQPIKRKTTLQRMKSFTK